MTLFLLALLSSRGPAYAGPPFRTDDPEPVEYRHWEVYGFSTATWTRGDASGVLPGIEINYGAAPDMQVHIVAPVAFQEPAAGSTRFGYGDTELGIKYRFIHEEPDHWQPQIGFFPLLELPTGDADRGLGAGHTRVFLPVWAQKTVSAWTTYGGGGYWINPGAGNRDFWFCGWLLQRHVADELTLGGEIFYQTADTTDGPSTSGFNLGGLYDFSDRLHLLLSGGRGLHNVGTTNEFSFYLGLQWTT